MPGQAHGLRTARLFIALWPDDAARRALADCRDRHAWPPGAAPVPDAKLHLTVHFIGSVPAAQVGAVAQAVAAVPARAVDLRFDRVQAWHGGLLVLLARHTPPALADLHRELGDVLRALQLPVEGRRLRPHVTLARRADGVSPVAPQPPLRWCAQGHVLVQSLPDGRYRVLGAGPPDAVQAAAR